MLRKIKKYVFELSWKCSALIFGLLFSCSAFCDPAADPLAAIIKPQITALFGPGSTVSYCIYVGEIVLGAIGYAKSKNPLLLVGVPILVIFTAGMFSYIATT